MCAVKLVLAEADDAVRRVLEVGLRLHDFEVFTVPSVSAAVRVSVQEDVHVVLLDSGLEPTHSRFDPEVTVIEMSVRDDLQRPHLWIQKPFDPARLSEFLRRRYRRTMLRNNRRSEYRGAATAKTLVLNERTSQIACGELINVARSGVGVFLSGEVIVGDSVRLTLSDQIRFGSVTNTRLGIAITGELRQAVGIQLSAPETSFH